MSAGATEAAERLTTALDRFFDSYYALRPVNATFTGVHEYDALLPDWSPEGHTSALEEMRSLRVILREGLDATRGSASAAADTFALRAVDAQLAEAFLEIESAELESVHFQRGNPALATGEAIFAIISLMTRDFAPLEERVSSAASRLSGISEFLAGARRGMLEPAAPAEWTRRAIRESEAAARLFARSFDLWLDSGAISASLRAEARHAADDAVGAFVDHAKRLRTEVQEAPATRYACGSALFDFLMRRGHWGESGSELLARARDELADESRQLVEMAESMTPGGWLAVREMLEEDHPAPGDYLAAFESCWRECRALVETQNLLTWPHAPLRFVPIPPWTRDDAPGLYYLFYRSPAPLDAPATHEHVVAPLDRRMTADAQRRVLRASNFSAIKLNHVVHHAAVGHHVQNARARHTRSRIGQVAAVDCASRIGMFGGGSLAEGWACYATDLMEEAGFFTLAERVAQQHTRVRLLARAVVDIELHAGTISFDEAVSFYVQQVGMTPDAARGEVVKSSMFPATAIMYWFGTSAIHELRRDCEARSERHFVLRDFHDRLLGYGALPVPVIASIVSRSLLESAHASGPSTSP